MGALPFPAWRRAHWEARGRLKPAYDAVVIGAGHNGLVAVSTSALPTSLAPVVCGSRQEYKEATG